MIDKGYKYHNEKTKAYTDTELYWTETMIHESLFAQYARKHGARSDKNRKNISEDFVSISFDYDVPEDESDSDNKKPKVSKDMVRQYIYENGITITWWSYDRDTKKKKPGSDRTYTYRRLVRSPGKAKDGSCIFARIEDGFCDRMNEYLTMGLSFSNRIVELSAYSSLVTATAIDYIRIPLKNIFVVKDEEVVTKKKAVVVKKKENIRTPIMKKDFHAFDEIVNENGFTFYKEKQKINPELIYIDRTLRQKYILSEYGIDMGDCPKVETGEYKEVPGCVAETQDNVEIKTTLWDGMGIIDDSIFPSDKIGFIYCRSHFFKSCLFRGNIQQYFQDYFGEAYSGKKLIDYTGRTFKASDIKVIISDKSLKWLKFLDVTGRDGKEATINEGWKYFSRIMKKSNETFAIVKTGHKSKYGGIQRMSYQMVNSLLDTDRGTLTSIASTTIDYYNDMKLNDDAFIDYLEKTANNCYDIRNVLIALYRHNDRFRFTDFYKDEKNKLLSELKCEQLMLGKLFVPGDNLTLCGNVIAMLKKATGQDWRDEGCFEPIEDGIQCYTERFAAGEYLAAFRSPHNSPNNILHLENVYPPMLQRYFSKLGENVVVVNGIGTDIQARLNGADYDTDSALVTNQMEIVDIARRAYLDFSTIVNRIDETGKAKYNNDMKSYAEMDSKIARNQYAIGQSSNLAQLALSYWHDGGHLSQELLDAICILSVLAQLAIDSAKRNFDIDINREINRISRLDCMKADKKYPVFYAKIQDYNDESRKESDRKLIVENEVEYRECPMDILYDILRKQLINKNEHPKTKTQVISLLDLSEAPNNKKVDRYQRKRIKATVEDCLDRLSKLDPNDDDYSTNKKIIMDEMMNELKNTYIKFDTMKSLIQKAMTDDDFIKIRCKLFVMLYDKQPDTFISCFKKL